MNLKRTILRVSNCFLAGFGLSIQRVTLDFDARVTQAEQVTRMLAALAQSFDEWMREQTLFTRRKDFVAVDELETFYTSYISSLHRQQFGGSRFNNLAFLYLLAKAISPSTIVDSGTYTGSSAWALSLGSPQSNVLSFDIDMSALKDRLPTVQYIEGDWTSFDWETVNLHDSFVYFDDHVDQARRLLEAAERQIPLAIFDDDFPVSAFAPMAHNGDALPKIEFVLDDTLRQQSCLTWTSRGRAYSWTVPHAQLDRAKSVIAATARLPNTSLITGIHQTPYRIVKLK